MLQYCMFDIVSLAVNARVTARLPTGKSLVDIQREEAVRAERDRAAAAAAELANASAGWAKASGMIWLAVLVCAVVLISTKPLANLHWCSLTCRFVVAGHAWGSSAIGAARHASVRDILEEEQRQQATTQMQSNYHSNSSAASMAAGTQRYELLGLHLSLLSSHWHLALAQVVSTHATRGSLLCSSSTRDVVNPWGTATHSTAEDQVVEFQPHRAKWEEVEEQRRGATGSKRQPVGTNGGQAHAGNAAADVSAAAAAHLSDDELFWDYGATPTTQLSAGSAPVNLQVWSFTCSRHLIAHIVSYHVQYCRQCACHFVETVTARA